MKYAVVKCVNGNFFIDSEGFTAKNEAIIQFHGVCRALWNEPSVKTAEVKIVDEQLNCVDNYKEFISHLPEPEPEKETTNAE